MREDMPPAARAGVEPGPGAVVTRAPLHGRTIVVTGASRGLGAGLARRFDELGASIGLCARASITVHAPGPARTMTEVVDVTDADAVEAFRGRRRHAPRADRPVDQQRRRPGPGGRPARRARGRGCPGRGDQRRQRRARPRGLRAYAVEPGAVDSDMQAELRAASPERFASVAVLRELKAAGWMNSPPPGTSPTTSRRSPSAPSRSPSGPTACRRSTPGRRRPGASAPPGRPATRDRRHRGAIRMDPSSRITSPLSIGLAWPQSHDAVLTLTSKMMPDRLAGASVGMAPVTP